MPSLSSVQDSLDRNGHSVSDSSISESNADFASNTQELPANTALTQTQELKQSQDGWSSVTQELIDTLPRAWTRGLLYVLLGFISVGLPWAMLSKVDETGSARGRLEPQGRAVQLDAPVTGTVVDVNVKEGQTVKVGQTLLELDSEITQAEIQQAEESLDGHLNRLAQLEIMENQLNIALKEQQFQNQAQQAAQLAQIDQTQKQLNAAVTTTGLARTKLEREEFEVARYQRLVEEGITAEIQAVQAQRLRDESQGEVYQSQAQINQAGAELKKQQSTYKEIQQSGELAILQTKQQLEELQTNISDTKAEIAQTRKKIQALKLQRQQRVLRAPVDGTVFQLEIQHAGSVVQPGQKVVQIAPEGLPLVFRAQMPSEESGFLKLNAPVKLKFDAYPYQDYGVLPGHVRWLAPDSKIVETPQGNVEVFEIEVALDQDYIQGQGRSVPLTAGQTATAEVVVRQRRVIDFILDPFKKLQESGLEL